jgi:hypothetical protein
MICHELIARLPVVDSATPRKIAKKENMKMFFYSFSGNRVELDPQRLMKGSIESLITFFDKLLNVERIAVAVIICLIYPFHQDQDIIRLFCGIIELIS